MKEKVNLTLDGDLWRTFRAQCIGRKTSASQEIETFIQDRLKKWGVAVEEPQLKKGGTRRKT